MTVEFLNFFFLLLRMDSASCLFNIPERRMNEFNKQFNFEDTLEQFNDEIKLKATFPGELQSYELKDQCQHIFGPESDVCDHNLVSRHLLIAVN